MGALLRSKNFAEFGIPVIACFIFLLTQAAGQFSELALTAFIIVVTFLVFILKDHTHEPYLFLVGVVVGIVIEIGFRFLGYQQVWAGASLFGVPYWLPIMWGLGFIIITRFGIFMRGIRTKN